MTPELPRAPISDPWRMAWHTSFHGAPASRGIAAGSSSSPTTDSRVRAMLVPVSPSGTGYTLSALSSSWWERSASR